VSAEHRSGCLSCGAPLVYEAASAPMRCEGCGHVVESNARCEQGHFFCDACHSGDVADLIEQLCLESTATDPVALSVAVMRHPRLKMHGAEHHYLTPAALLTAYCALRGEPPERKRAMLREAKRRATQVPGGTCGLWGACGAAVGTGIFVSVVTGLVERRTLPQCKRPRPARRQRRRHVPADRADPRARHDLHRRSAGHAHHRDRRRATARLAHVSGG
jgi:hypothetical protein